MVRICIVNSQKAARIIKKTTYLTVYGKNTLLFFLNFKNEKNGGGEVLSKLLNGKYITIRANKKTDATLFFLKCA